MRLFLCLLVLCGAQVWADCHDLAGTPVHYCVFETVGSTNPDVIYYFHGLGGKAEQWGDTDFYTEKVREEWTKRGVQAPKIVAVSFGPFWLLSEKNASPNSGLLEVLRDQVIPALEQITGGTKGKRILLGESMGGFNTIQLSLKSDLFQRAAILCAPVLYGVDMFSTPEERESWILKSAAYSYYGPENRAVIDQHVTKMMSLAGMVWPDRTSWLKSDPVTLASSVDKSAAPVEFYVNAGFYDPYLLYEGNIELVKQLLLKKLKVEWHPEWGGHCQIDAVSLSRFLVP